MCHRAGFEGRLTIVTTTDNLAARFVLRPNFTFQVPHGVDAQLHVFRLVARFIRSAHAIQNIKLTIN